MPKYELGKTGSGNRAASYINNFQSNDTAINNNPSSAVTLYYVRAGSVNNQGSSFQPHQAIEQAYEPHYCNTNAVTPVYPYSQPLYNHPHMSSSISMQMDSSPIQEQKKERNPIVVPGYQCSYPNYLHHPHSGISYPSNNIPYQYAPSHTMKPVTGGVAAMTLPAMNADRPKRTFLSKSLKFPVLLYRMLMDAERVHEHSDAMSFLPHGRAFKVHNKKKFEQIVMPKYFANNNWKSFRRQLNLYNFIRISDGGLDDGAYYHKCLLKGRPDLLPLIVRTKIKGGASKNATTNSSARAPNFYLMKPVSPPPDKSSFQDKNYDSASPNREIAI